MDQSSLVMQNHAATLEFALSHQQTLDADSMAKTALDKALRFCTQKMKLGDLHVAVLLLQQENEATYGYFYYDLAAHIAEYLGTLDGEIKAVYLYDYDATSEDACFGEMVVPPLLHLIVWAQRKTVALNSLAEALDRALVQNYAELIETPQLAHLLDVQVVDDADVKNRVGYGALFSSVHYRPVKVWER